MSKHERNTYFIQTYPTRHSRSMHVSRTQNGQPSEGLDCVAARNLAPSRIMRFDLIIYKSLTCPNFRKKELKVLL